MSKRINLQSLLQAKASLSAATFQTYLEHHGVAIKSAELADLAALAAAVCAQDGRGIELLDGYYVGYKIPQIGKEFDLLRIGAESILNVELKRACSEEKILAQLLRNKYYLSFIGRKVLAFTFVSTENALYRLTEEGHLAASNFGELSALIAAQTLQGVADPDALFDPSAYLVSPFNSTARFLASEYFLTHQQEDWKAQILSLLQSSKPPQYVSITGSAGTGKTLLTYDIAKAFMQQGKRLVVVHCGNLNDGQLALNGKGWQILPIKALGGLNLEGCELIVVDEAQRIYGRQLEDLLTKAKQFGIHCIFSYDGVQTLHASEAISNMAAKIESLTGAAQFRLSEKIRTNKEIATFIKLLFSTKRAGSISAGGNIQVSYFQALEDARKYLESLRKDGWEVLRFTPSQYNNEHHEKYSDIEAKTAHRVIGQEFDAVAIAIDEYFRYDEAGDLVYVGGAYYAPKSMLFQNLTRARKRLNVVLINNEQLLGRCLEILS